MNRSTKLLRLQGALLLVAMLWGCSTPETPSTWKKGNLHTHSLWSDGDQLPEMIVDWYATRDYDFLAISDHNVIQEGTRWRTLPPLPDSSDRIAAYRERFGDDWVEYADSSGTDWIRLKTFDEYRVLFDRDGEFLLLRSEEITDGFEGSPIHMNATNIQRLINPQHGSSVLDVLQRNVDAVLAQREETGQPIMPHVNHPNFGWGLSPADLVFLQGEQFFEVYNGHPSVRNEGDSTHLSMDALWDVVLAERLTRGWDILYGIGTDDAHHFLAEGATRSNPGRGWVVVSSDGLTPESLIGALEAGHFYASSGVSLDRVTFDGQTLTIAIDAEESAGQRFTVRFIGTKRAYAGQAGSERGGYEDLDIWTASEMSGLVFKEQVGTTASYTLDDNDLYVRALVISDALKPNPYAAGELEQAWVQPVHEGTAPFDLR